MAHACHWHVPGILASLSISLSVKAEITSPMYENCSLRVCQLVAAENEHQFLTSTSPVANHWSHQISANVEVHLNAE